MQRYLAERLTPAEQADAGLVASTQRTPERDAAPAVIRQSMLFPYEQGLRFVRTLYAQGGWDAVNDAYRDPPRSTEQLLHPERYLGDRDQPEKVEVADFAAARGRPRPASELASSCWTHGCSRASWRVTTAGRRDVWDGGRLRTFQRVTETARPCGRLGLVCRATPFWGPCAAGPPAVRAGHGAAGSARFSGDGQRAALVCRGPRVAWLSAPDRPALDRLVRGLGGP